MVALDTLLYGFVHVGPPDPFLWLGVQFRLGCPTFSLVSVLPSTISAGGLRFCSTASQVLLRCTTPRCRAYGSYGSSLSPIGLPRFRYRRQRGLSVLAHGVSMHAWASTTPPGDDALASTAHRLIAFRTGQDRRPPDCLFRSSMSLPAYAPAPVNASSAPLRSPSHDSDSR